MAIRANEFAELAMSFAGTTSAPHMDRTAFRVKRIYTTLAADGLSANLKLTPDEQEFKCQLAPDLFTAIPNGWGRQGWTTIDLTRATKEDVQSALKLAHYHAL